MTRKAHRISVALARRAYKLAKALPFEGITLEPAVVGDAYPLRACPIGAIAAAFCDVRPETLVLAGGSARFEAVCARLRNCENVPVSLSKGYETGFAFGFDGESIPSSHPSSQDADIRKGYADAVAVRRDFGWPDSLGIRRSFLFEKA